MIFSSQHLLVSAGSILLYSFACILLGTSGVGNSCVGIYLIQFVKTHLSDVLNPCNIFI